MSIISPHLQEGFSLLPFLSLVACATRGVWVMLNQQVDEMHLERWMKCLDGHALEENHQWKSMHRKAHG